MPKKIFSRERHFEKHIEHLSQTRISKHYPDVYILHAKKTVDIVICKDRPRAQVFFLELKYFNKKKNHSIMAFGGSKGGGFQPAVLKKRPRFFRKYLRWVMGSATDRGLSLLTMDQVYHHLSGISPVTILARSKTDSVDRCSRGNRASLKTSLWMP